METACTLREHYCGRRCRLPYDIPRFIPTTGGNRGSSKRPCSKRWASIAPICTIAICWEDCLRRFPTIVGPIRPCGRICATGSRSKPSCICWSDIRCKPRRKWSDSSRRKPRKCKLYSGSPKTALKRPEETAKPRSKEKAITRNLSNPLY